MKGKKGKSLPLHAFSHSIDHVRERD